MLHAQHARVRALLLERRASLAEVHAQRHDHRLAQRINRRIGDLCESLAQEVVQRRHLVRQHRERRVITHAPHDLGRGCCHRFEDHAEILMPISERELQRAQLLTRLDQRLDAILRRECRHVLLNPARIRPACGDFTLRRQVAHDATAGRIHQQHAARAQLAAFDHIPRIEVDDADFRARHHHAVRANLVAARAQTVPVQRHRDLHTIAVGERRRSVPRLDHALVVLVKRLHGRLDVRILLPRLRDQHHRRMYRAASGAHQQLERVVEAGRVAAARTDGVAKAGAISTELRRIKQSAAHRHRVAIAPQRVDLTVVPEQTERLRQFPAWQGVGGVAFVKYRNRRLECGIEQIGIELRQLSAAEQAFVHDRAARERTEVERCQSECFGTMLHLAARQV